MKRALLFILIPSLTLVSVFAQQAPSPSAVHEQWNCQITFDNMGPFDVVLHFDYPEPNTFTAHSTPNADKRIFGNTKAILARWMKKSPKKGIFMQISNGRILANADCDSIYGVMHIPMIGSKNLRAIKNNDSLYGSIMDKNSTIGYLRAYKSNSGFDVDYTSLNRKLLDTLGAHIYDPALLDSRQWKRFAKKLDRLSHLAVDDLEYFFGFNLYNQKLPFSHLNLFLLSEAPDLTAETNEKYLFLKETDQNTALLNVTSFEGSAAEVDSIFDIILSKNYKTLIVDLRENGGGGLNSAIRFGNYLCPDTLNAGYFVSNKWMEHKDDMDQADLDFSNLETTKAITTSDFIEELKSTPGKQLVITPGEETFRGKIFLLTSNKTASTCEPIVYSMKNNKLATVVGETTAGAMLSAALFGVQGKYYLFLPVANYYTPDGITLDQVGVEPTIKLDASQALDYVVGSLAD